MAHEVWDGKILSHRQPMWHNLGQVTEKELTAERALDEIGDYDVQMIPVQLQGGFDIGYRAIVRDPGTPNQAVFGVVGGDYHLVTPRTICQSWDEVVKRHVETIGALRNGSTFFVSTKLGEAEVGKDHLQKYLLLISPMSGLEAIQALSTTVRTVCMNTLNAAKSASIESFTIPHNAQAEQRTKAWLAYLVARSEKKFETQMEAFKRFMQFRPTDDAQVDLVLKEVFPDKANPYADALAAFQGTMPKTMADAEALEEAFALRGKWNADWQRQIERTRARVKVAFTDGSYAGADVEGVNGTFYGLYNAITEDRDWSNVRIKKLEARARDTLFGVRAQEKERAYTVVDRLILSGEAQKVGKSRKVAA